MTRTRNQQMADSHEADIAEWIGGRQTKGSGNQWHAQLDAKNGINKVPFPIGADGKATAGKSIGVSREMWRKAEEQSFGEIPALFLRFYRDETLRTVGQDLVVLDVDDFKRILDAARSLMKQEAVLSEVMAGRPVAAGDHGLNLTWKAADGSSGAEGHHYVSTYCQHALKDEDLEHLHEQCRETCKICAAPCKCQHHQGATE